MGTVSEQLNLLNRQLGYAKDSINNKYNIMDIPSIESLKASELSPRIDDIPVLNTKDATATESDILNPKTAYKNSQKITGNINDLTSQEIKLEFTDGSNLELCINGTGYIGPNTKFKIDESDVANQIQLSPDIIKKNETILGITGECNGLDVTNDATATEKDIAEGLTAYVKENKITGTLLDYRGKNVNVDIKLNGSSISVILPAEAIYNQASSIGIDFSKITNLIGLTPDIIKKGEVVLGITGTYTGSEESGDTNEDIDDSDIVVTNPDPTGVYYNIDSKAYLFKLTFKWGYYELLKQQNDENAHADSKLKAYIRIYNTFYINGCYYIDGVCNKCDGYFINDYEEVKYAVIYNHPVIENAITCYVGDLGLTTDECEEVYARVISDCPELMAKFSAFYCNKNDDGTIKYLFFDTFDETIRQEYMATCLETFNEICSIIESTYGITYTGTSNWLSSASIDDYTSNQKFKIAKVIHDYLSLNNIYGNSSTKYLDQTMYAALSKGKEDPVCASYAFAFQWCCQKFGIWCLNVHGESNGELHMWNMICYEQGFNFTVTNAFNSNVWNEVDVTWDDTDDENKCRWKLFNTTTEVMESSVGGNRVRAKLGVTSYGNECYNDYISECTCTDYVYSGSTIYGGL